MKALLSFFSLFVFGTAIGLAQAAATTVPCPAPNVMMHGVCMDPENACMTKLGPSAVPAADGSCICKSGYALNTRNDYCVFVQTGGSTRQDRLDRIKARNQRAATARPRRSSSSSRSSLKPEQCLIKGNINVGAEKAYYLPGCMNYNDLTINARAGERWFCTENEAKEAGWHKARVCNY